MKKIVWSLFLVILLLTLPQAVSTSPGSEEAYVFELNWGSWGYEDGLFSTPRRVAVDSGGYVYVADTANHRIQKFDSFGGFLGWWGLDDLGGTGWHPPGSETFPYEDGGNGDGQFNAPWGICVDSDNNVYVADTSNHRIQKFDSFGGFLGWWGLDDLGGTGWHPPGSERTGKSGTGEGAFSQPRGVAVDSDGNIYVADTYNHRIQKFNSEGKFELMWGGAGYFIDGKFYFTGDVAVDSSGDVYVTDIFFNNRIQKFDSDGNFITKWGSAGTGDGQFNAPWGICVDSDDNIYVADTNNHRIQKFDSDGGFLGWWGYDNYYSTKWHPPGSETEGEVGYGDGQLNSPYGVAVDLEGNIYVADTMSDRIQKIGLLPPLGVTYPNGGEVLSAKTTINITWNTGLDNNYVKIEFSANKGTDWEEIAASTENDGLYEDWYIPCNLSVECLIRITGLDDLIPDVSDDVFSIESSTPPVITLIGPPEIYLECGIEDYDEPGASAEDGCGKDVPVVIKGDTVDTMTCDTYTITYDAIDASGQAAVQKTRTVIVHDTIPPDPLVKPLLTVEGECSVEILTKPTAKDSCAGIITGETSDPLSYNKKGTYTVLWIYDDLNGNITEQTQTVIVKDTIPPEPDVASLKDVEGECSVEILTKPTATDNCAGAITGETTDPLEYTEQGTYTVTWTYDDGNGNTATQTQKVNVIDVTPPVPDAVSLDDVEGECKAVILTKPTATDNCAGAITGETTDPLSYTEAGTYTVTWTYDDGNGNTATQTQTVKVEDVTPPTIDLSDSTCVDIHGWKVANMLTVSASDNCSADVELVIDKVKILNKRGHQVWGRGIYRVVGNDIYVFPNGKDWSIVVTVTASDSNGNTTRDSIRKPLLQCNRWSAKMARLIRLVFCFVWKYHRCW
jgi:hypothetical protein